MSRGELLPRSPPNQNQLISLKRISACSTFSFPYEPESDAFRKGFIQKSILFVPSRLGARIRKLLPSRMPGGCPSSSSGGREVAKLLTSKVPGGRRSSPQRESVPCRSPYRAEVRTAKDAAISNLLKVTSKLPPPPILIPSGPDREGPGA